MTEIYVNGQSIDLSEDVSIPLNFSIVDNDAIVERKGDFSKTFRVPNTSFNKNIFQHLYNINALGTDFIVPDNNQFPSVEIFNDNIQVFRGNIMIESVEFKNGHIEYYICRLFSASKGLFIELEEKKLSDLSFNDSTFLNAEMTEYINEIGIDIAPFYWGIADVGQMIMKDFNGFKDYYESLNNLEKTYIWSPFFYVKSIIDKIFSDNGYKYQCEFFQSDWFKRLVIPFNKKDITTDGQDANVARTSISGEEPVYQIGKWTDSLTNYDIYDPNDWTRWENYPEKVPIGKKTDLSKYMVESIKDFDISGDGGNPSLLSTREIDEINFRTFKYTAGSDYVNAFKAPNKGKYRFKIKFRYDIGKNEVWTQGTRADYQGSQLVDSSFILPFSHTGFRVWWFNPDVYIGSGNYGGWRQRLQLELNSRVDGDLKHYEDFYFKADIPSNAENSFKEGEILEREIEIEIDLLEDEIFSFFIAPYIHTVRRQWGTGFYDTEWWLNDVYIDLYEFDMVVEKIGDDRLFFNSLNDIKISSFLSEDTTQRDFLLNILKTFNLYIYLDENDEKRYNIDWRDNFYKKGGSIDLTEKTDSEDISIQVISPDYKYIVLNNEYRNDFHSEDFLNKNNRIWGSSKDITNNRISNDTYMTNIGFISTNFVDSENVQDVGGSNEPVHTNYIRTGRYNVVYFDSDIQENIYTFESIPILKYNYKNNEGNGQALITPKVRFPNYVSKNDRLLVSQNFSNWLWDKAGILGDGQEQESNIDELGLSDYLGFFYKTGLPFDVEQDEISLSYRKEIENYHRYGSIKEPSTSFNLYRYWTNLLNTLNNSGSRRVSVKMNLSPFDIKNIKLNDKIFLDLGDNIGSSWFLFERIRDYVYDNPWTKVDLIRIIDGVNMGLQYNYKLPLINSDKGDVIRGGTNDSLVGQIDVYRGGTDDNLTNDGDVYKG